MEACVILCPHETIISKSEADFDTQRRRRAPRDLEGSVATLLRLPNRFAPLAKVCVVTHFIIVGYTLVEVDSNHMEACVILCPHETIISKSEADFDTQRRRRAPRDLEGSVATLLRLPNRFAPLAKVCVVTHFIIVGRLWDSATSYGCTTNQKAPLCKGSCQRS